MKRKVTIAICILIFLVALTITIYPLLSNLYNTKHQAKLYTKYTEKINNSPVTRLEEERAKAKEYNEALAQGKSGTAEYNDILNLSGDGIMGYVNVPKIDITLPIYHSTAADVLENGIGHMPMSSLPIGGNNTHSVLTAHSGMSSQKMFSDIDTLVVGDVFYIDVLGEQLYYSIYEISVVLPYETQKLQLESGKDKCSLVTCTPFGVNTHRLIVTAERIEVLEDPTASELTDAGLKAQHTGSTWEKEYKKAILVGVCVFSAILFFCIGINLVRTKRKRFKEMKK